MFFAVILDAIVISENISISNGRDFSDYDYTAQLTEAKYNPQEDIVSREEYALLIALVAVFFGPMIQLVIAKSSIRAQVRAGNRQQWINTLRDEITGLLSDLYWMSFPGRQCSLFAEELIRRAHDVMRRRTKIKLLINPKEKDHSQLVELIDEAVNFVASPSPVDLSSTAKLVELHDEIVALSQSILKREWKRVKRGG